MSSSLDGAERRAKSKKWSPMEVEQLMQAIQAANCPPEDLNWAEVATNVDGRTGKQCREKYKVRDSKMEMGDVTLWMPHNGTRRMGCACFMR